MTGNLEVAHLLVERIPLDLDLAADLEDARRNPVYRAIGVQHEVGRVRRIE